MPTNKILTYAGISSASLLATLPALFTLAPVIRSYSAHAETPGTLAEPLGASATINSTLGLSVNSVDLKVSPSSTGAVLKTGKSTATVSTNNETGYTLYLSDSDSDNALKHANLSDAEIPSTTESLTGTAMLANTWGYTLGSSVAEEESEVDNTTNLSLTYSPIPTARATIKKTEKSTSNDATPITFGVKVDTNIPSGVYSGQVSITAIPNYNSAAYENAELWLNADGVQITTMQEMTHDICASVPSPTAFLPGTTTVNTDVPKITLTDARDGAAYIVRKLADGNCWMSENLKISKETTTYPGIEGKTAGVLESTLTDMVSGTFDLPDSQTEKTGQWGQSGTEARIYKDTENTYYENGVTKKSGTGYSPEYYQNNYYNFYVATLNSTNETYPNDAPSTICPKNWTLPANGDLSNNQESHGLAEEHTTASTSGFNSGDKNSYSFTNLAQVYRMSYTNHWNAINGADGTNNAAASARLRAMPLSFPFSGFYNINSGVIKQGSDGHWWSSTATSATSANDLGFHSSRVVPQNNYYRGGGFSVRCVAR